MKKGLIATTALIAAGMVSSGAMAADKVKLELGGYTKWYVVGAWNNTSYEAARNQSYNNVDVKGRSDITFKGSSKLDNGLDVGVEVSMRGGTNTGVGGSDANNLIDKSYLYVASSYGKVIAGVLQNGTHLLQVQAPESIGHWNNDGLLTGNAIIARPSAAYGINGNGIMSTSILAGDPSGKQEGITYVAPTFYGLTIGGSFIPNTAKNVRGAVDTTGTIKDIYGLAANYTNSFDGFGVKASFGWARGTIGSKYVPGSSGVGTSAVSLSGQEINFFNAGLNFSYSGFTLGGSFRWNVQDVRKGGLANLAAGGTGYSMNGHAWDAGLMYATGPWAASVSYFGSRQDGFARTNYGQKEDITFVQASAKYDLGPGVSLEGLVGYGDYKASTKNGATRTDGDKNNGWTALTGVQIKF